MNALDRVKRLLMVSSLVVGSAPCISITALAQDKQAQASLKQAALHFEERRYRKAIPILETLVAANPNDDQAIF